MRGIAQNVGMAEVPEPDPLERPVSVLAPAMEFGAAFFMLLLQRIYFVIFYPAPLLPCIDLRCVGTREARTARMLWPQNLHLK